MLPPDAASLKKTLTGIEGFDQITGGGLPLARTSIIMGGPGSGKTVFALQTLFNGAHLCGERGIFVAFEENSRSVIANAASFGWDLTTRTKLIFMDAGMSPDVVQTSRFDIGGLLSGIRPDLPRTAPRASCSTPSTSCWPCSTTRSPSARAVPDPGLAGCQ